MDEQHFRVQASCWVTVLWTSPTSPVQLRSALHRSEFTALMIMTLRRRTFVSVVYTVERFPIPKNAVRKVISRLASHQANVELHPRQPLVMMHQSQEVHSKFLNIHRSVPTCVAETAALHNVWKPIRLCICCGNVQTADHLKGLPCWVASRCDILWTL